MANRDLRIGDRVRLLPTTTMDIHQPWNPLGEVGTVAEVDDYQVLVTWPSYSGGNVYYNPGDSDLELASDVKFHSRDKAREEAKKNSSFIVADMGPEAEYRWELTTKEI